MTKIAGYGSAFGSISHCHGSAYPDPGPDPHQNVMDPQHCGQLCLREGMSLTRYIVDKTPPITNHKRIWSWNCLRYLNSKSICWKSLSGMGAAELRQAEGLANAVVGSRLNMQKPTLFSILSPRSEIFSFLLVRQINKIDTI
jgi:hypothetical protein